MYLFRDVELEDKREVRVALHFIFGVGWYKSILLLSKMGFSYPFFLKNMNLYFFFILSFLLKGFIISNVRIERRIILDLQRLTEINSYIGLRHALTLPVHGQRTRSNASTQRSKRIRILAQNIKKSINKKNNKNYAKNYKTKKNKNKKKI